MESGSVRFFWRDVQKLIRDGFYTLAVSNGPHVAPIVGGYVAERLNWRWCFIIPAIFQFALWVVAVFTLPETLFSRTDVEHKPHRSFFSSLLYRGRVLDRPLTLSSFTMPFKMIKYWAVILPSMFFMTANTYASLSFALSGAQIASEFYHFSVSQTGLLMGVPLTIGCIIGEASAGWVSDLLINNYAKRHDGYRKAEVRLYLIPLCPLATCGIISFGICVQHVTHWIWLAVSMAVAGVGLQISTTMVYSYVIDSYKPQASEVSAVINLFRFGTVDILTFLTL